MKGTYLRSHWLGEVSSWSRTPHPLAGETLSPTVLTTREICKHYFRPQGLRTAGLFSHHRSFFFDPIAPNSAKYLSQTKVLKVTPIDFGGYIVCLHQFACTKLLLCNWKKAVHGARTLTNCHNNTSLCCDACKAYTAGPCAFMSLPHKQ